MDGFFSRIAWVWLEGRSSEFPHMLLAATATAAHRPARKTWAKHAGHQRTLAPHRASFGGLDDEFGPPPGP
jgi:hypothetical protein